MKKLFEDSQLMSEGYEKVVMNILADAGIEVTTFSHGVLYVGASAMDDAKNILDNHPEIFRTPPIDDFDNLYESKQPVNESGSTVEDKNLIEDAMDMTLALDRKLIQLYHGYRDLEKASRLSGDLHYALRDVLDEIMDKLS